MEEDFIELTGTIIFMKEDKGSKSEKIQPFLYVNKDKIERVYLKNSNPFENNELHKYDGKAVTAKGSYKESVFFIEEILI